MPDLGGVAVTPLPHDVSMQPTLLDLDLETAADVRVDVAGSVVVWRLDRRTREVGHRGVADARAALARAAARPHQDDRRKAVGAAAAA